MDIFGMGIETFALTSLMWLAAEFIDFSWHRGPGRVSTAIESQPIAFNDSVVPFRRPASKLTDRQLIEFAKSIGFAGSSKWSFNRKLSGKVRDELQQLWGQQLEAV